MIHTPVLSNEVLEAFKEIKSGTIVDCTLGYAGHSSLILEQNGGINLVGCDRDKTAAEYSTKKLEKFGNRVKIYHSKFSEILKHLDVGNIRGILADIGLSSLQIDQNSRGFSLNSDTLDMRMDVSQEKDAKFVINSYSASELERILREYGELKDAKFIASKIVKAREFKEISTAKELVSIIGDAPMRKSKFQKSSVSKATLVFQAVRIEVNSELDELTTLLTNIRNLNLTNCIVAIISFHSLEDRVVKNTFKEWSKNCICPEFFLKCECGGDHALGEIITKKAITPSQKEMKENSRSRCAKMRVFKIK